MPDSPTTPAAAEWSLPWRFRCLLPYVRHELLAWGRLYAAAGGGDDRRWRGAGTRSVRGKLHGYRMDLDLSNWSERLTWFLARYHDLATQMLLQRVLRPGDCFVDVGANIGMLTALGRRCVGPSGRVIACEPNPRLASRIKALVAHNGLEGVTFVGKALGAAPGRVRLREFAGHSGWGTLAERGPADAVETASFEVEVVAGDSVLAEVPAAQPMIVKVDVEGYEVPVLRGLTATLRDRQPLVIMEVGEEHQQRAGFSGAQLRQVLADFGYRGLVLDYRRRWSPWRRATLRPLLPVEPAEVDVLFAPSRGFGQARLAAAFPGA